MTDRNVPSVSVTYARNGTSTKANELGMRVMQERAYEKRGEQYLLIKSPPASGKSRALMFIALDKLHNQGLRQAIIVVPEKSIGSSFADEPLSKFGFWADWTVEPRWNLCNSPGTDGGKVNSVGAFLECSDRVLVCTHATFRFAVERFGVEAFDDRLIAIDEFHHVSANPDNKLGGHLGSFMARDKAHIVAMTGSYFRGDAEAVLMPTDEAKFETVTYTYYEQLNGYEHLKNLDIGYFFYNGPYVDDILRVLDSAHKTILHIPNVNARESTKDKHREVEHILDALGEWQGTDPVTGFQLVKVPDGWVLRIADLVDDEGPRRDRVSAALKDPAQKMNREHVDIIIALGMAKEGFDWIWCEHALTVGYRASLTEVVQIIGRATRDAPGKVTARFTNLIAEPDASEGAVTEAVNDTLKAIAASLLMEQVLAPRFEFKPKTVASTAEPGFDYGEAGYDPTKCNVGFNPTSGKFQIEIKGQAEPKSEFAQRVCTQDLNEVITAFVQDKTTIERGLFDSEMVPEELTQVRMGKIVKDRYPQLDDHDQEAVRQHAVAFLTWLKDHMKQTTVENRGPILVVAPTSLLRNWEQEVETHVEGAGFGTLVRLYGSSLGANKRRDAYGTETQSGLPQLDMSWLEEAFEDGRAHRYWVLTTYTTLANYQHSLGKIPFSAMVMDEIQNVKNRATLASKAVEAMNADFRIGLTGTPIENAAIDLWTIMDRIAPGCLGSGSEFSARYACPDVENMTELHARVFKPRDTVPPLGLRRLKSEVARDLPAKRRFLHPRLMPKVQAEAYDLAQVKLANGGPGAALKMLHHIRSVSVHPGATKAVPPEDFIAMSARLDSVIDILHRIKAAGERVLVFIEHRDMQFRFAEIIRHLFGLEKIDVINGDTPIPLRQEIVNRFQRHLTHDGGFDMLILGPKAAGTGLTLTAATHVIHLSRWWNPAVEEQCNDRVHRIGQSKPVSVHIPMALHPELGAASFDSLLQSLMQRKRKLAEQALWPMGDSLSDVAGLTASVASASAVGRTVIAETMAQQFQRDGLAPITPDAQGAWELI